jgi:hypothetical protein
MALCSVSEPAPGVSVAKKRNWGGQLGIERRRSQPMDSPPSVRWKPASSRPSKTTKMNGGRRAEEEVEQAEESDKKMPEWKDE